jgi:hypothetical protein
MTINIVLAIESEIYLAADRRLTKPTCGELIDNSNAKILLVHEIENANRWWGAITYTGIAAAFGKYTLELIIKSLGLDRPGFKSFETVAQTLKNEFQNLFLRLDSRYRDTPHICTIGGVIPPFLMGPDCRTHAANCCFSFMFSFWTGVIPPSPMLGRSLL